MAKEAAAAAAAPAAATLRPADERRRVTVERIMTHAVMHTQ